MTRFLLLGRPECHLCETYREAFEAHMSGQDYRLDSADVDSRAEWRLRFGTRIPVLLDAAGRVLDEGCFDAEAFERNRAA
ncbi:MAG: glutaredoxin family protein [Nevskiales bacterium]|nr:glutaredoxin family protein [Nevskiales bacterium]